MQQIEQLQILISIYSLINVRASNEFRNSSQLLIQIRDFRKSNIWNIKNLYALDISLLSDSFTFLSHDIGMSDSFTFLRNDIGMLYTYTEFERISP